MGAVSPSNLQIFMGSKTAFLFCHEKRSIERERGEEVGMGWREVRWGEVSRGEGGCMVWYVCIIFPMEWNGMEWNGGRFIIFYGIILFIIYFLAVYYYYYYYYYMYCLFVLYTYIVWVRVPKQMLFAISYWDHQSLMRREQKDA